ncbi:radical SAM protein [Ferroglobus sp.]|uniref:radical SAM protein n=1 Tax=Ferroglobus sp. TaxID=2614230 RepID=UPI0025B84A7A|nr:radical SAM protein [Ferroglobus sp.]
MLDWRTKLEIIVKGVKGNVRSYRKSGGGPTGGVGFEIEGSIVSAPNKQKFVENSPYRIERIDGRYYLFKNDEIVGEVRLPKAEYYSKPTSFGIEAGRIVALDGINALVTAVSRKCVLWREKRCKFCSIEVGLKNAIVEKTPEMIAEAARMAYEEDSSRHLTVTSGIMPEKDRGVLRISKVVRAVKREIDIPVHVQVYAAEKDLLELLYESGADTIGIHAEVLDEKIRNEVVPGKPKLEEYFKAWENAVDVFGKWKVNSWVVLGFNEDKVKTAENVRRMVEIGVTPFLAPYRPPPHSNEQPVNVSEIAKIYELVERDVKRVDINKAEAGCFTCGGCTAVKELIAKR